MVNQLLQSGFLIFLFAPALVSIIYLYYLKSRGIEGLSLRALGISVISIAGLTAAAGIFLFRGDPSAGFVLALHTSSEKFGVSIGLSSGRFLWILGNAALFLNYLILFGEEAFSGSAPVQRYLYILGAFFTAGIVFLADEVFMSVIFVEISFFLMHAFHMLDGGLESGLERVSYIKRSAFIFMGLALMMVLYAAHAFSIDAIILFGTVLYAMSLLFSRHNFLQWSKAVPGHFPVIMAFFIASRILRPGLAGELWLPLSIAFSVFSITFMVLSMMALTSLNAFYWWSIAIFCELFALQFSVESTTSVAWSILAVIVLLCVTGIGGILEQAPRLALGIHRYMARLATMLLYVIAIGALPGICVALQGTIRVNYAFVSHLLLVFVLGIALGKMLFVEVSKETGKAGGSRFLWSFIFAFAVVTVHYVTLFGLTDAGALDAQWRLFGTEADFLLLGTLGLALLGILIAFFLSGNQKYISYLRRRERDMQNMYPEIDPRIQKFNAFIIAYPQQLSDTGVLRLKNGTARLSQWACSWEERFLQEEFWREAHAYLSSLSRYVRYFHRGSVRFYVLLAIVFFVVFGLFMIFV